MRVNALFGTLFLGAALVGGCTAAGSKPQATATYDQTTFNAALDAAEKARNRADGVGGEWRDTRLMLKEAQELAAKGEFEPAIKLADQARKESDLGYQQALSQQEAGPRFGPTGTDTMAKQKEYDRAMAAAQAALKKAQSVDSEWRDTGTMMKEAQALAEKGEYEQATALAKEAAQQSAMAYVQGTSQKTAGPRF